MSETLFLVTAAKEEGCQYLVGRGQGYGAQDSPHHKE